MALELDTLDVLVKTGVSIRELVIEANVSLCVGVSVLYECRAGDPSRDSSPYYESAYSLPFLYLELFQVHSIMIFWKHITCISG